MILLFDTDVIIDILRGIENTVFQVEDIVGETDLLACSVITVSEIYSGMRDSEEKNTILLLQDLIKEPVNESIAELAGNLRRKTKSHQLWLDDTLIAATAIQSNATLVTKNAKHYPFKNLKVIKIS